MYHVRDGATRRRAEKRALLERRAWAMVTRMRLSAARLFMLAAMCACAESATGPEAAADAFADAYFAHADQAKARQYTAFGASKMLDQEIAETKPLRDSGYTPSEASLQLGVTRGARSQRGERVRFDYALRAADGAVKHATVELSRVAGEWKVVRVAVGDQPEAQ